MKQGFWIGLLAAAGIWCGCQTHDRGPYLPQTPKTPAYEATERFVLLDPGTQRSVTCSGIQERVLPDGRLEVVAQIRNRENRRIEVQVNCVFKDINGYSIGDETPFQTLILTENATEQVRFVSMSAQARKFTIRVRQAR
ncbi:MAG: YcfL family protein [Verrucomicrobiota bacterium]|nr:YcfL family protein [Limisphaera sp.]MDW8382939.1 YcfL family protein [Verrucomicrobiota bacterium]